MNDPARLEPGIANESLVLAARLGEVLRERKWSCAVAESCTGGLIGHLITSVAGSSDYFPGGIISYSNDAKIKYLSVSAQTLQQAGAVSSETAEQMARGARSNFESEVGISSTGIAGPGGATARKPVGLIYVAVSTPDCELVEKLLFEGNRAQNIQASASAALRLALRALNS